MRPTLQRLLLLLLLLLPMLLPLLRVGLDVFKAYDPSRDRLDARQQLMQHSHLSKSDWCWGKARADARGCALADASIRCSGARQASSFSSLTPHA